MTGSAIKKLFGPLIRLLHKLLFRVGVKVTRAGPMLVDVRDRGNHPYCRRYYRADEILLTARVADGRSPFFYSCAPDSANPFIVALTACIRNGYDVQPIIDTLRRYYATVQPTSALDYLGINPQSDSRFTDVPAWAFVWPWENTTIEQKIARLRAARQEQARRNLGTADLSIDYGWKFVGPVSETMLLNEATRLHRLALSVRNHGLLRHNGPHGDILAAALMAEHGKWCWSITSGHHRAAALAAAGYSTVPVRIQTIVSRSDVNLWPNVIDGLYTPTEALAVFDNLVHGRPPSTLEKWSLVLGQRDAPADQPPTTPLQLV